MKKIDDTHRKRIVGTDDGQVRLVLTGELKQRGQIFSANADTFGQQLTDSFQRDSGVAGRAPNLRYMRGLCEFPDHRVFASTCTNNQYFHVQGIESGRLTLWKAHSSAFSHGQITGANHRRGAEKTNNFFLFASLRLLWLENCYPQMKQINADEEQGIYPKNGNSFNHRGSLTQRHGHTKTQSKKKKNIMHGFLLSAPLRLCGLMVPKSENCLKGKTGQFSTGWIQSHCLS